MVCFSMWRMASLPQADVPCMVALCSICNLLALLQIVPKAKTSAMMIHTDAARVLEDFGHHGSDTFAFAFSFLCVIRLPLVPLLALPLVIFAPLFVPLLLFPLTFGLSWLWQRDQMENDLGTAQSLGNSRVQWSKSCQVTSDCDSVSTILVQTARSARSSCWMEVFLYP